MIEIISLLVLFLLFVLWKNEKKYNKDKTPFKILNKDDFTN